MLIQTSWSVVLFKSSMSLLIFLVYFLHKLLRGLLKSLDIIVFFCSVSYFNLIKIFFMYFGTLLLHAFKLLYLLD